MTTVPSTCGNCLHFSSGVCRRYPPTLLVLESTKSFNGEWTYTTRSLFPPTTVAAVCGEHAK